MMRSLYSGVSGLRVHQTKMDVIGNNISNVNTVGFKASSVNFSDIFYQKTQSATGPNAATGAAGQNAMQIGLGSNVSSITTNITQPGGAQRTDGAFDVMINGDNFFAVKKGGATYFTKDGAFYVDGGGSLAMKHGGAKVLGWQVDPSNPDLILKGQVSELQVMSPENMQSDADATKAAYITGNIDAKDPQLVSDKGYTTQVEFYDKLGNSYKAVLSIKKDTSVAANANPQYIIALSDILDSTNKSIFVQEKAGGGYEPSKYSGHVKLGGVAFSTTAADIDQTTGKLMNGLTANGTGGGCKISFDGTTGEFVGVDSTGGTTFAQKPICMTIGEDITGDTNIPFFNDQFHGNDKGIVLDFSHITQKSTNNTCSLKSERGSINPDGTTSSDGKGWPVGKQSGYSIDGSGKIYAHYDNGLEKLLGQIAVASFANPSGLEAAGGNLFSATQNSGSFDGVGKDPSEGGDGLSTGMLEMSNADLSQQFTDMITTQRGFQANSRIITTSDSMLEELINLKR